jgi:putative DNA primase/helicase
VDFTDKGKPKATIANLEILFRRLGIKAYYDEIAKDAVIEIPGKKYHADNKAEAQYSDIVSLCVQYGLPDAHSIEYLSNIVMKNAWNPVREWIKSRVWDGVDRLPDLYETLEMKSGFSLEFRDSVIRRWLISAVAAAFEPNFRNRGVLVLQGRQGLGKTTWFSKLTPRDSGWFTSRPSLDVRDKDSVKQALSYWITELGELEGVLRIDMARLKAFLTLEVDEFRLPYGRTSSKFARRTVFCASVNQAEFLSDTTGNSRWWVLPVVSLNYDHKIDLQQLWSEVHEFYRRGERWYFNREEEEELTSSNWMFEQVDEIEDMIRNAFDWDNYEFDIDLNYAYYMTATEVLRLCKIEQPNRSQAVRAGEILRRLTGSDARRLHGGKRCYLMPRVTVTVID